MELVEFLLARIGEDEARVKAFADSPDFPRGMVVRKHWRIQLAECAAKRRIVERAQAIEYAGVVLIGTQMAGILADLALPYRDHHDYDPAWNPEGSA